MACISSRRHRSQSLLAAAAAVLTCLSASAQTALPYESDFESPDFTPGLLHSDPDWGFDPLTLSVEITDAGAASAAQSLALQGNASFDLDFNDPTSQQIRWIDFYLKPVFSSADSLPETITELRSAVAAFVAEAGSGQVYVIHGDGLGSGTWVSAQRPIELSNGRAQDWLRLSYRLDYAQQRWDLFLNDQLALFDLGFLDNSFQQLQQFRLQASADLPTGLDFFYAGFSNPIAEDADNDGIPDSFDPNPNADDRDLDADNDGLINIHELQLGTALNLRDSDGDGHSDYLEYRWSRDPLTANSDLAQLLADNANGYVWQTHFELNEGYHLGALSGQLDWYASPQVAVTDDDSQFVTSPQPSTAYVERFFATQDHPQIWFGFEGKFQAGTLPDPSSLSNPSAAAVFGFAAADTLQVLDVANHVWLSYSLPLPATAWARYALYFDYLQSSWDLYQEGQLVASGLPFVDPSMEALTRFRASIEKAAGSRAASYLDAVKVYAGPDFDGDGLDDAWERFYTLSPAATDSDRDGTSDADTHHDEDGLTALEEFLHGTNLFAADTDSDGVWDDLEITIGSNPTTFDSFIDSDADGAFDIIEAHIGTDPLKFDTDGDGLADSLEGIWEIDPLVFNAHLAQLVNSSDGSIAEWQTGFDTSEGYISGPLHTQQDWQASDTVQISEQQAQITDIYGDEHYFERYFGVGETREIWLSFRAALLPGPLPDPSNQQKPTVALWGTSEHVKTISIWQPNTQVWESFPADGDTRDWNDYLMQLDYQSQEWMLLQNGQVIARSIPFKDNDLVTLSRFKALQAGLVDREDPTDRVAYFDDFQLSNTEPAGLDFDQDGLLNSLERSLLSDLFSTDTDSDGLPDSWEYQFGLNLLSNDANQDLDADLISNHAEFIRGLDPKVADENQDGYLDGQSIPGTVFMQQWDLVNDPSRNAIHYIERKDPSDTIAINRLNWDTGLITLNNPVGRRVRGYITAPATGEYQFWLYGNDYAEFWLSPNASPFDSKRIAFNPIRNFSGAYEEFAGQSSKLIELQAGEHYYFEVLHYGNTVRNFFSIAWKHGSLAQPTIIEGEHLSSFVWDPEDLDDDSLSDAQERIYGLDPLSNEGKNGRLGDFDGDGWSNFWELQRGTDPSIRNPFPQRDRSELFPQVEHVDSYTLDNWTLSHIGRLNQHDAFEQENGTVHIAATGKNVHNFAFAHKQLRAPFKITTQVQYSFFEDTYAEAGIKIRGSIANRSAYYDLSFSPDGRIITRLRPEHLGRHKGLHNIYNGHHSKVWLQVQYDGSELTSAYSYDNVQWFELDRQVLNWTGDLYVGLAATSLDPLEVIGAQFDAITIDQDFDGDGLWDPEEASLGTDPLLADTDGDGYSDFDEVKQLGSDPLVFDLEQSSVILSIDGSSQSHSSGNWESSGSELYSIDSVGNVEYLLAIPHAGAYRLAIDISDNNSYAISPTTFELQALIDEFSVGTNQIEASNSAISTVHYYLPYLIAGNYNLLIKWLNGNTDARLKVHGLRLEELSGPDVNSNGIADWVEKRAQDNLKLTEVPDLIYTSPVCIEGTVHSKLNLKIESSPTNQPEVIFAETFKNSTSTGFYSNIILDPVESRVVRISEGTGSAISEVNLTWTPFNLFKQTEIDIRLDDALLLTAFDPEEASQQALELVLTAPDGSVEKHALPAGSQLQARFDQAGQWHVAAYLANDENGIIFAHALVNVFAADLSPSPLVIAGHSRQWHPNLSSNEIRISSDEGILLSELVTDQPTAGFQLALASDAQTILARLPNNGAILDSTEPRLLREQSRNQSHDQIVAKFSDGTEMVRMFILLADVPDDLTLTLRVFKSGVTFEDGTVVRELTKDDFDENGRYQYYMLRAPGVGGGTCHSARYHQGGQTLSQF